MYIRICCCRNLSYNKFTELPQLSEFLNNSQFPTKLVILDISGLNIGGPFPIWTSSRLTYLEQLWVPLPLKYIMYVPSPWLMRQLTNDQTIHDRFLLEILKQKHNNRRWILTNKKPWIKILVCHDVFYNHRGFIVVVHSKNSIKHKLKLY
jgi:hypothetical protein